MVVVDGLERQCRIVQNRGHVVPSRPCGLRDESRLLSSLLLKKNELLFCNRIQVFSMTTTICEVGVVIETSGYLSFGKYK